jgi:hypothetical protein
MNWKQERKQERRRLKGLRRDGWSGVVPPSLGKRHLEIAEDIRFRFDEFLAFIDEHEGRIQLLARNISYWSKATTSARERLEDCYAMGGVGAITKMRFPESYLIEIDDDDTFEVLYSLRFA